MEEINKFIADMIDEKKLDGLTDDVKKAMVEDIAERLLAQIDHAVIASLTKEQADTLSEKIDDPNFTEAQMQQYIADCGVDARQITINSLVAFREAYLGNSLA